MKGKIIIFLLLIFVMLLCSCGTNKSTTSENKSNTIFYIKDKTETTPFIEEEISLIDNYNDLYDEKDLYYKDEPYYGIESYYGADLSQFPPKVRDWIVNSAFTKEKMENNYMINPGLRVWWGNDDNSVNTEASYTMASGFVGAGQLKKWGQVSFIGSSNINETYGEYAKYHTLRFEWELKQKVDRMLRNDPAFAEIIAFAKKLCREIEYDWKNYNGYRGPVRRTPNMRYAVCEGYANEVMDKALKLKSVDSVQLWNSPGHAWNVLKLIDGRTLYFDLTWFDNEHINHETGIIYQTEDYKWSNITFDEHLFRFSNVGYGTKVFAHNKGQLIKEEQR